MAWRDIFADVPEQRRRLMGRVKATNSKPEMQVRRLAHALGYRFRLHVRELPGTPDLIFPRHRKAIFVHGCFWHRHTDCYRATMPKTRADYWQRKFADNVERDARRLRELKGMGWRVLVVWECETNDLPRLRRRLGAFLAGVRTAM